MITLIYILLCIPITFVILLGVMELLMKMSNFGRNLAKNIFHPLVCMFEGVLGLIMILITLLLVVSQTMMRKLKEMILFYYRN